MDLREMREYIRYLLQEDGQSDHTYSDGELNDYINEAYRELIRVHPYPEDLFELITSETYDTTDGDETVPTDFDRVVRASFGGYACFFVPYEMYDALEHNSLYEPTLYNPAVYFKGSSVHVRPVPSASTEFVLWYIKIPDTLSEDTDEPAIRDNMHEFICDGVLERCKLKDNETEEAGYHYNRMRNKIYMYYKQLPPERREK